MNKHFIISAFSPEKGKFATVFLDISQRKDLEARIKRESEELARSNAELQQFVYVAAHDLQEPLRMVTNYLSLLERHCKDQLDPKAKEYAKFAFEGGARMRELIDDLLEYSRVGTQGRPFEKVRMDDVVLNVIKVFKGTIQELDAKIWFGDLPMVTADEIQMSQLMQNLIGNALKFHGARAPEIRISAIEKSGEHLFRVEDNGIGFKREYAEKIFQIFTRLHGIGEYPGTGIGLAIAKKVVERHGGTIWVESEEGKGSTFFFTIAK